MDPQVLLNAVDTLQGAQLVPVAHPMGLVDLDPTSLINFGFFLLLMVVFQKLFFAPYVKVTEKRAALSGGVSDAAAALNAEAAALNQAYEQGIAAAHQQASAKRSELLGAAHATESKHLDAARLQAGERLLSRRAVIAAESAKAESELPVRAKALALSITERLLS
jgi:F0F1-type ATP synthase membrane subunit b/b'